MTQALFEYIKGLNKDQSYWYALGSNQQVYNCDNGKFITKAEKAYDKKMKDLTANSTDVNKKLRQVFGAQFPKKATAENRTYKSSYNQKYYNDTEEFIEDYFTVDIKYNISIDCKITQNGFRPMLLKKLLGDKMFLAIKKHLEFYIDSMDSGD